ncbi:MAG TPA: RcpC/CpaB family pilus assembly protein [Elusimicrobiota bacterium]|nr:RcpC/CpaB family pilus assembly protein [Elusimicrobiota bacterium]
MKHPAAAVLALAAALSACRAARRGAPQPAFAPPPGKRAFSLSIDKSQTRFLKPGDAVEVDILLETPRADGIDDPRSEVLAPRAEVLRVEGDWSDDSGLISLALTPEEAEYAALAVDREDRLFLDELPEPAKLEPARAAPKPALEAGSRGLAALVYADQQEFLSPGDRVDVIATRENGKASGKSELAALTLFQDVTVLDAAPPDGDDDWSAVQLSLSPGQAEELTRAIAGQDNLSLAVRAPEDAATRPVEPARMSRKFGSDAERASPKS